MGAHGIPAGRAALPAAGRLEGPSGPVIPRIFARSAPPFKGFLRSSRLTFTNPFDR
jgi:hypothetical protein